MKRWQCPKCNDVVLAPRAPSSRDVRRYCLECSKKTGKLVDRFCVAAKSRADKKRETELAKRQAATEQKKAEREAAIRPALTMTSPAGVYLDLIRTSDLNIRSLFVDNNGELRELVDLAIKSMCTRSPRFEHVLLFQTLVQRGINGWLTQYGIHNQERRERHNNETSYFCLFCGDNVHTRGSGGKLLDANLDKIYRHGCACAMEYLVKLDQETTSKEQPEALQLGMGCSR